MEWSYRRFSSQTDTTHTRTTFLHYLTHAHAKTFSFLTQNFGLAQCTSQHRASSILSQSQGGGEGREAGGRNRAGKGGDEKTGMETDELAASKTTSLLPASQHYPTRCFIIYQVQCVNYQPTDLKDPSKIFSVSKIYRQNLGTSHL